jgi:hypothetical protein
VHGRRLSLCPSRGRGHQACCVAALVRAEVDRGALWARRAEDVVAAGDLTGDHRRQDLPHAAACAAWRRASRWLVLTNGAALETDAIFAGGLALPGD